MQNLNEMEIDSVNGAGPVGAAVGGAIGYVVAGKRGAAVGAVIGDKAEDFIKSLRSDN